MPPTDSSTTPSADDSLDTRATATGGTPDASGTTGGTQGPESPRSSLVPGTAVTVRWTKWPGTQHWEHECVWLGSDKHGDWLGQRVGARSWRPGRDFRAQTSNVVLVPAGGDWAATFYGPGHASGMEVYIDLGRSVGWAESGPATVVGVDMDLDVVRDTVRGTWVDDEDELEEHAALWGYPGTLVTHLHAVAATLHHSVEARRPPFDDLTPTAWLTVLDALEP